MLNFEVMKWQHALKDYKHYLKIERGLSQNSKSIKKNHQLVVFLCLILKL